MFELIADPSKLAMWLTFLVIAVTMAGYAMEWASLELVSLGAIVALMVLATFFPQINIGPQELLTGFSNPALFTILALLVVGQALIQTEALTTLAEYLGQLWPKHPTLVVIVVLIIAGVASSIVNNTPVVVVFIPVLASILNRRKMPAAKYMMPLSYITILGGMVTILGSSTNLLAAGVARDAGIEISFFAFAVPGAAMALAGAFYVLFIAPLIVTDNQKQRPGKRSRSTQFISEIHLTPGHPLVGEKTVAGMFAKLTSLTVRAVRRGKTNFLPPFDDITLRTGDTLIIAATRSALTEALRSWRAFEGRDGLSTGASEGENSVLLYEALVPPGSRLINNGVDQAGFMAQHDCLILGVERRSRMPRQPLSEIRLEAGDVLLIAGQREAFAKLRGLQDLLVMEWSGSEIRPHGTALKAQVIFALTIGAIATGLVPMVVAAIAGAFAMIASGCLNVRQAARAIDRKIVLLVGSSIAMAHAMASSGGADFIADVTISQLSGVSPGFFMSGLFLVVAILTNFLSNNATAVLFTPIAIAAAARLGIDPLPLIVTVILGANASFASPIGYQTNLLVMGAGHYRFRDFIVVGAPLVIIVWVVFSVVAPWYYGF